MKRVCENSAIVVGKIWKEALFGQKQQVSAASRQSKVENHEALVKIEHGRG
jgi:hypothetical protein